MIGLAGLLATSLLFSSPAPRRCPAPACREGATSSVPADEPLDGARSMRIDQRSLEQEEHDVWDKPPATREEMAAELPAWAASIMLDGDVRDEYENDRANAQAAAFRSVSGRNWEDMVSDSEEEMMGMGGDSAGMGAFTPVEIAEDYNLPPEAVLTRLLSMGIAADEKLPSRPVRDVCNAQQARARPLRPAWPACVVAAPCARAACDRRPPTALPPWAWQVTELLNYVAGADAIAERDSLIDETLGQLGEELQVGEERLEELCEMLSIPLVLGRETRLKTEDYTALLLAVRSEIASR